jgi:hypothetical protein
MQGRNPNLIFLSAQLQPSQLWVLWVPWVLWVLWMLWVLWVL